VGVCSQAESTPAARPGYETSEFWQNSDVWRADIRSFGAEQHVGTTNPPAAVAKDRERDISLKMLRQNKNQVIRSLLKVFGLLLLCLVCLYLYEVLPRFITPTIALPSDDYRSQSWTFPAHSVITPGRTRYFTWRANTILSYEGIPEQASKQLILNHFDKQLQMQGWIKSEYDPKSYGNCFDENIFPEAAFLRPIQDISQDGYVTYKRQKVFSFITSKTKDEVCLAIWRHWENVQGVFNVVIFTIKPSPFTWLLFRNEFLFSQ